MSVFIDIICSIKPEPYNWSKLFEEYQSLSKDGRSALHLSLLKDISVNENNIFLIQVLAYSLSLRYNEDTADQLRVFYPKYTFKENYLKEIQLTLSGCKSMLIKIREKRSRLKDMQSQEAPKPTDWDMQFVYLSKFMGVKMTAQNTNVGEYVNAVNYLKESSKENGK